MKWTKILWFVQCFTHQDEIEQGSLINIDEFGIPRFETVISTIFRIGRLNVLLAVLNDLRQDLAGDIGDRDGAIDAVILDNVPDGLGLKSHRLFHLEGLAVGALQDYLIRRHRRRFPKQQRRFDEEEESVLFFRWGSERNREAQQLRFDEEEEESVPFFRGGSERSTEALIYTIIIIKLKERESDALGYRIQFTKTKRKIYRIQIE